VAGAADPSGSGSRGRVLGLERALLRHGEHPEEDQVRGRPRGLRDRAQRRHRRPGEVPRPQRARLDVPAGRQNGEPDVRRALPAAAEATNQRDKQGAGRGGAHVGAARVRAGAGGTGALGGGGEDQVK